MPLADRLEVTELRSPRGAGAVEPAPGDTPAPDVDSARWRVAHAEPADGWLTSRSGLEYRFLRYARA